MEKSREELEKRLAEATAKLEQYQHKGQRLEKLGFLAALGFLHGVPESGAVLVLSEGMGWQENVCADHAALAGEFTGLAIVFAVKFLPGAVGGTSHGGLSRATFDLGDMKMKQGQLFTPLPYSNLAHKSVDIRQGKNLLHKNKEGPLAHTAHFRDDAFYCCPTGDKPVRPFSPFTLLVVTDAVFQPLAFMLVLLQFGGGFGKPFFQFLA